MFMVYIKNFNRVEKNRPGRTTNQESYDPMKSALKDQILIFGRMIKFSHTIFALPFALSAVVMAWKET